MNVFNFVVLAVIVILIVALLPSWPYSRGWGVGYYPSGGLLVLLVILLILFWRGGL